jgi:flagellar biosynthesis/type III secretory pathway chaperone
VYEVKDMPNKEISLQFARGLILMSLDERVNWAQFSKERRDYRENLMKKKAATKAVKKEREGEDEAVPVFLGKKRCVAEKEGLALKLTIKSESAVEGAAMEKKGLGRGRVKDLPVSPIWDADDLDSMASIIKKNTKLVENCRVLLRESTADRGLVADKLRRARILLSDRQAMMDDSKHHLKELSEQEQALQTVIAQKRSLLADLEISGSSEGCEESRQLRSDIANSEAKNESFCFKKALEERTILQSSKAVAACNSAIFDLESDLERSTNKNMEIETRVSSLEGLLLSME